MIRFFAIVIVCIFALSAWTGIFWVGSLEGWWRQAITESPDPQSFFDRAANRIDKVSGGNAAFALLEDGGVYGTHFAPINEPIDGDTLFQSASLSKWISAWGVMTLVDAGKLDLDAPVSNYLTRWRLPQSDFDHDGVTVRRLLSHTAGLDDGLGYGGFAPGQEVQTLPESLTRAADASPNASGVVRVGSEPGSAWKYSGGGYTLLQLIVEEVSGQSFQNYMEANVFVPLGMTRSTYVLGAPMPSNVAVLYDEDGAPATNYTFASLAATSLYTSVNDLTQFLLAQLPGPNGEPVGRDALSPELVELMHTPHAKSFGADIWGLGVILYAPNSSGGFIIGHDGDNEPAINTTARIDPASGDGIIILETGTKYLATSLAGEWVFWRFGKVDTLVVAAEAEQMFIVFLAGSVVIVILSIVLGWRFRKKRALKIPDFEQRQQT